MGTPTARNVAPAGSEHLPYACGSSFSGGGYTLAIDDWIRHAIIHTSRQNHIPVHDGILIDFQVIHNDRILALAEPISGQMQDNSHTELDSVKTRALSYTPNDVVGIIFRLAAATPFVAVNRSLSLLRTHIFSYSSDRCRANNLFKRSKFGVAIMFVLKCFACPYRVEFSSSNFHEGIQIATINTRFFPYGKQILNAAKLVYEDSIQKAANEAICENEGYKNIAVAVDGTWQRRGYTTLNGVVTVSSIGTGNVKDVDILSKYCTCKNLPFHENDCKRNYVASSGAMELQGASKIFQQSLSLHNARYITYLGDGDRKAFDAVKKKNIYGNEYPIEKLECIGHVMKRAWEQDYAD
ncbi:uncharacterized protein TNCV_2028411 [Trichonephila clavipes]|nr:uncharacterized protein TNCV_2028411 [Trichonephila clavipes]